MLHAETVKQDVNVKIYDRMEIRVIDFCFK